MVRRPLHDYVRQILSEKPDYDTEDIYTDLLERHLEYRRVRSNLLKRQIREIVDISHQADERSIVSTSVWQANDAIFSESSRKAQGPSLVSGPTRMKRRKRQLELVEPKENREEFICACNFKTKLDIVMNEYLSDQAIDYRAAIKLPSIRNVSLLIHGATGAGKTCAVTCSCAHHGWPMIELCPLLLDFEDNVQEIIDTYLQDRVVILVQDIGGCSSGEATSSSKLGTTGDRKVSRLLCRLMQRLRRFDSAQAVLIATTTDMMGLSEKTRMSFDKELQIHAHNEQCRSQILNRAYAIQLEIYQLPVDKPAWMQDVASLTPGYLPIHLIRLSKDAFKIATQRPNVERPDLADYLKAIKVGGGDHVSINAATALLKNAVDVPETNWLDIGALEDVRKVLHENLCVDIRSGVTKDGRLSKLKVLSQPSGVMLVGPPGCGKTLMAKAVANELSINFLAVSGPELLNMYVGESERAVRLLFQQANQCKPCIIFFDEIDALCPRRWTESNSNSGQNLNSGPMVVNQLLVEMDGIRGRDGVFLMAATNIPDSIDRAIMRPGRFGTLIYVGLPNQDGRLDILKKMTSKVLSEDGSEYLELLASNTDGYSGADLNALVCHAARHAFLRRCDKDELTRDDLKFAYKRSKASISADEIKYYEEKVRPTCNSM